MAEAQELQLFLRLWREAQQQRLVEPYAEVVYAVADLVLKRVPLGKPAQGSRTAFSVFATYGVELRPIYDYYVQPAQTLSPEEVLVHAIVFATNPVERTDCAVFYAKNRTATDFAKVRSLAQRFGVDQLTFDLENYVRNVAVSAPDRFLPWEEFAEKVQLYGVDPQTLLPSATVPDLLTDLAQRITKETRIYVFGGEAMRIRGLKRATKDVDLVVEHSETFAALKQALLAVGYRALGPDEIPRVDQRLNPSGLFVKEGFSRVDIFVKRICNAFDLSASMQARAERREIRQLKLGIMSNEDVFLLKSVTDREGDIHDMIQLAKAPEFTWEVVVNELYSQEQATGRHFCRSLLDSLEAIEKRTNIKAPFYNHLVNHCIDQAVVEAVGGWNATTLRQIRELVNYPEYRLRRRIDLLVKRGELVRTTTGRLAAPSIAAVSKST